MIVACYFLATLRDGGIYSLFCGVVSASFGREMEKFTTRYHQCDLQTNVRNLSCPGLTFHFTPPLMVSPVNICQALQTTTQYAFMSSPQCLDCMCINATAAGTSCLARYDFLRFLSVSHVLLVLVRSHSHMYLRDATSVAPECWFIFPG